jgi:hypothetical protein
VELHQRWLADLRSERMKIKTAFAEGKLTDEEYMEQNNQNKIDLSLLTIQEVYALRSRARKEVNNLLLNTINLFLNGRSGGRGESLVSLLAKAQQFKEDFEAGKITPEEYKKYLDDFHAANNCPIRNNVNQRHGSTGTGRRYIEAGKLYQGNEKILVLVPHGSPEDLNAYSLQFWHLQEILNNADFQEDPDTSDIKNPEYVLMNPTFYERYKKDGVIQKEIEKADIVLELSGFGNWIVVKTPHVVLDNRFLWVLKFPEVTLKELLVNNPKEIWVYIDHRRVNTNVCENMYHAFARHMAELGHTDINLRLMSGHPPAGWTLDKEIVLMATPIGFFVDTARETPHTQKLISKLELIGYDDYINPSLTCQCRTESIPDINIADAYPKSRESLDPNDDPGQFYRSGFGKASPLPHELPNQGYTLSAQARQCHDELSQSELTKMSIARFGYILVHPDTGLTLSKEEQDKHVEDIISSVSKNKD